MPCCAVLGWAGLQGSLRKLPDPVQQPAAEAVKELAQFPLGAVAAKAGKRLWMSEYASGNYAVTDIRTGLDLSTQVHCSNCKHVCRRSRMQHAYEIFHMHLVSKVFHTENLIQYLQALLM